MRERERELRETTLLSAVAAASLFVTLIFVNRWFITDLGVLSFGRVWQYFVSYADFGFARRELWGTVLSLTGINRLFANAYYFSYAFYILEIFAFVGGIWFFLLRRADKRSVWFYFALFFSPVLVLQSGYLTGTQDLQLLLIAMILTLYVKSPITFAVGCCAGVLTHELFVFLLPFLFLAYYFKTSPTVSIRGLFTSQVVVPATVVVFVILITVFGGRLDVPESRYDQVMAQKMPAAAGNHSLWSGYTEVAWSIERNAGTANGTLEAIAENKGYVIVPVAYTMLVAVIAVGFTAVGSGWFRGALFISILFPMLTVFVATDVYRWIGMSGNLAWLLILAAMGQSRYSAPRWCFMALALFVVVAPFGAAEIARPFPAQQLLLEKAGLL
jgi:hypothetical protein